MDTKNVSLNTGSSRWRLLFLLAGSAIFCSFAALTRGFAKNPDLPTLSDNCIWFVSDIINRGEGGDFVRFRANNYGRHTTLNEKVIEYRSATLISSYDFHIKSLIVDSVGSCQSTVQGVPSPAFTSASIPDTKTSEFNIMAAYVPLDLLPRLSESDGKKILGYITTMPSNIIEKLRQNPERIYKLENLDNSIYLLK